MALLEIKHARKSFGQQQVLKDISLSVNEGQVVSIIGPSGSGKSTLLRCATLLETLDGGSLAYNGEYAAETDDNGILHYATSAKLKEIRSCFGLVFQNFNLFPHYSVLKNVMEAPMLIQKKSKQEACSIAMSLLDKMGLADRKDAYPCQLSGGQQQRVSIARALAMHPKILFFDEPTSALDPELTGEVLRVIRELKNSDTTMIIVTHEMGFARSVSDQIIFMANGIIEEQGTPDQIFGNPQSPITQAFLSKSLENP